MLTMIELTSTRAVFEERRTGLRAASLVCIGVTAFSLVALGVQWQGAAVATPERVYDVTALLALAAFMAIILIFGAASVYGLLLSRTLTLTLDRDAGAILLVAPRGLRMATETLPYYGVKSVRLTGEESLKALALVFVLRDGRVVPVTAAPAHDRERLEALASKIREILAT